MWYSMSAWLDYLKPIQDGHTLHLVDPYSRKRYGYIYEFGPLVVVKIDGLHGDKIRAFRIFNREFTW